MHGVATVSGTALYGLRAGHRYTATTVDSPSGPHLVSVTVCEASGALVASSALQPVATGHLRLHAG